SQAFSVAMSTGVEFWDQETGMAWDTQGRCWGPDLSRRMADYTRSLSVILSINDESHPDNRVMLADDWPADEHGPVPRVVYHPTAATVERQAFLATKATEVLRAAGAHSVHKTDIGVLLTHILATMRMGDDPATSLVNADGEAHEVE